MMQEKIDEMDAEQPETVDPIVVKTVVEDVDGIKASLSKVDVSKERQLQNLLQGVQNLEDANRLFAERLDKMESLPTKASHRHQQSTSINGDVSRTDLDELKQQLEDKIFEDVKASQKHSLAKIVEIEQSVYSQIDNLKEGQTKNERQLSARESTASPSVPQIASLEKSLEKLQDENKTIQDQIRQT